VTVEQNEQASSNGLTDRGFARLLGREVRHAREARGWTRLQLVERLPSGITDRTLLSYEHGIRFMTVVRLVEICRVLEVPASVILDRALAKANDLSSHSFKVNLRSILRDKQEGFEQVRTWAATRLKETSNPEVTLASATVREMSAVLGIEHRELAACLVAFTSEAKPDAA
jgi:transcriptional regulator with XRE-family HTH domain